MCATSIVSISQVIGCEDRLRNDRYCVEWGVKLYSNSLVLYLIWHQYSTGTLATVAQLEKIIIGIALSKWQTEFTDWRVRFNCDWYLRVWWARQIHANCRVFVRVSESRFLPKPSKFPLVGNPVIQQKWTNVARLQYHQETVVDQGSRSDRLPYNPSSRLEPGFSILGKLWSWPMQMKVKGRTDYKLSRKRTGGRDFAIFLTDVFGNDSVSRVYVFLWSKFSDRRLVRRFIVTWFQQSLSCISST